MTGFNGMPVSSAPAVDYLDTEISLLWRQRADTLDIARKLSVPESMVAARLWRLREREQYRQSNPHDNAIAINAT